MSNQRPRIRFNSKGVVQNVNLLNLKEKNKLKKEKRNFKASISIEARQIKMI